MKIQVILGERVTPYMYLFLLYLIREKNQIEPSILRTLSWVHRLKTFHISRYQNPIHSFDDLEKKAAYTFTSFIHSNVSEFNIELQKIHIVV